MSTSPTHTPRIGFFAGLAYPLRGARMIYRQQPGFARYWVPPILLSTLALLGASWQVFAHRPEIVALVWAEPVETGVLGWALSLLHSIVAFLVMAAVLGIALVLALLVSQVLGAPFHDALSEAVERVHTGEPPPPQSLSSMLSGGVRAALLSALKLLVFVSAMVPLWLASMLVPVVGPVLYAGAGFLLTIVFLALDHLDWAASRHGLGLRARLRMLSTHRGAALGFGLAVWGVLFVPLLNVLLLPAAVAGGTLLFVDIRRSASAT